MKLAIIDYGMGNLHSVEKALQKVAPDADIQLTSKASVIEAADRVVFPGVGAIRDCMAAIHQHELAEPILKAVTTKPTLAICVGMQALMDMSEENGGVEGLGFFKGRVNRLSGDNIKVPHMGWNQVAQIQLHPVFKDIPNNERFYFVHSYAVSANTQAEVLAQCTYGSTFDVVLLKDYCVAVQFHPEKSQYAGLKLLENFVGWV